VLAAVVPIRSFGDAKRRLATRLDGPARRSLARGLADGVLRSLAVAAGVPTFVVTADPEVAELATGVGAVVVDDLAGTLDAAVDAGRDAAIATGHDRLLVAHADLPFPADLGGVAAVGPPDGVVLVPDRHLDGTNVIALPAALDFDFSYGVGSFDRHRLEAGRLDAVVTVVSPSPLAWDVDVPEDLDPPSEWGAPSWVAAGVAW
jgi:2-phospho-L-lactate guanylyltransferase